MAVPRLRWDEARRTSLIDEEVKCRARPQRLLLAGVHGFSAPESFKVRCGKVNGYFFWRLNAFRALAIEHRVVGNFPLSARDFLFGN